jgi:hypothetical protein
MFNQAKSVNASVSCMDCFDGFVFVFVRGDG